MYMCHVYNNLLLKWFGVDSNELSSSVVGILNLFYKIFPSNYRDVES